MITPKDYLEKGYNITPCGNYIFNTKTNKKEWNEKAPRIKKWQTHTATLEEFTDKDNIGLKLDKTLDIDVDNKIAHNFITKYLKPCCSIFGRKSNLRSHFIFKGQAKHKKFALHKDLDKWCEKFTHGSTLIELRCGKDKQTIVPGSTVNNEKVEWSILEGISPYDGDSYTDVAKIACATALTILYPIAGKRDDYCYAIACLLVKGTNWSDSVIDQYVHDIAEAANDEEAHLRRDKGTHARKQLISKGSMMGLPTIQNALGLETTRPLMEIFTWIGIAAPDEKLEELKKEYVYLEDTAEMYNIKTKQCYKSVEFNNKYLYDFRKKPLAFQKLLMEGDFQDKKVIGRAFLVNDKDGKPYGHPIAEIKKGQHQLLTAGRYLNHYKASPLEAVKGDVSIFLNTYKQLLGEENWQHLETYFGYLMQNLGVKCRWGPLVVTPEGFGKGIIGRTISKLLGYQYVNEDVSFADISEKHSEIIVGQLFICLNEVVLTGKNEEKMRMSGGIKNFWTDDFTNINPKGVRPYKYLNICNGILFSNNPQCLHLDDSSRRYLVIHVDKSTEWIEKFTADGHFIKLLDFINSDKGLSALKYYFINEVKVPDIENYVQRAPKTAALKDMQMDSRHPTIRRLDRAFENKLPPFNDMFVGFTSVDELCSFIKREWKISYVDDIAIMKWLRKNSFKWKNKKYPTRQIVMQNGERPHVWLLKDSDFLRDRTPIELGAMHKDSYWDYMKQLKNYSFAESITIDKGTWEDESARKIIWLLGDGGEKLIHKLQETHLFNSPEDKKILNEYTHTKMEISKSYDGKLEKIKVVDWEGISAALKARNKERKELNTDKNKILKEKFKNADYFINHFYKGEQTNYQPIRHLPKTKEDYDD